MTRTPADRAAFVAARADAMRAEPTEAELRLKELLGPLGFEFQVPIEGETKNGGRWDYIADALHRRLKLIVEADGSVHARTKGRDRRRGTRLAGEGWVTVRFSNRQILKRGQEVRLKVEQAMDTLRFMASIPDDINDESLDAEHDDLLRSAGLKK